MKSALIYERAFGRRERVAEDVSQVKPNFKGGLARINQELWLVLSLFVIAGLFNWLVASHRMILGLYTSAHHLFRLCLWPQTCRAHG